MNEAQIRKEATQQRGQFIEYPGENMCDERDFINRCII
jgi:hypothetical protein